MSFGLTNVGTTYQRAMNAIFYDLISHEVEVYIGDMMIKTYGWSKNVIDLREAFERI